MRDLFTHIIVPLDGSSGAELAMAPAEALALAFDAVMILLRASPGAASPPAATSHDATPGTSSVAVIGGPSSTAEFGNLAGNPTFTTPERPLQVEDTEASGYLHIRAEGLRERGMTVMEELHTGDPVEGIIGQAELRERPLIVIAGHSRSGIERLFFGSTADDLIKRAPCPVLFIRRDA